MKDFLLMKMTTIYYVKYKTKTDFRNIEIEFQKYGINYISQESYEMLYYYTFLHNNQSLISYYVFQNGISTSNDFQISCRKCHTYTPYQNEHILYVFPFEIFDDISYHKNCRCIAFPREFSYEFLRPILPQMIYCNQGDYNDTVLRHCALI